MFDHSDDGAVIDRGSMYGGQEGNGYTWMEMVFTAIMRKGTNRNRICLRKKQTQIPGYDLAVPQSAYHKGQAKEGRHGCAYVLPLPGPEQRDKIPQAIIT